MAARRRQRERHAAIYLISRTQHVQRGVTLIEVLIVVSIMALISAGIGLAVHNASIDARKTHAGTVARQIRSSASFWFVKEQTPTCPTVSQLISAGLLDEESPNDPWGKPYRIQCDGERIVVSSGGPDGTRGNDDDIIVPKNRS